jgi:integrase
LDYARAVAEEKDGHMGHPAFSLHQNMRRFNYAMDKFGATGRKLGVTAHGLRHEALIAHYQEKAGVPPPVRGGNPVSRGTDAAARLSAAKLAGHNRASVSSAYLGGMIARREALPSRARQEEPKDADG